MVGVRVARLWRRGTERNSAQSPGPRAGTTIGRKCQRHSYATVMAWHVPAIRSESLSRLVARDVPGHDGWVDVGDRDFRSRCRKPMHARHAAAFVRLADRGSRIRSTADIEPQAEPRLGRHLRILRASTCVCADILPLRCCRPMLTGAELRIPDCQTDRSAPDRHSGSPAHPDARYRGTVPSVLPEGSFWRTRCHRNHAGSAHVT